MPEIRQAAEECWLGIANHVDAVELDEWVVMPNHVHGVVVIDEQGETGEGNDSIDDHGLGVQLNAPTALTEARSLKTPKAAPRDVDNRYSAMSPRRNTLSVIVRTYKAAVTSACRAADHGDFAWQRGYYEHIVRSRPELDAVRQYIRDNPRQWELDRDNPRNMLRLTAPTSVGGYLEDVAKYR